MARAQHIVVVGNEKGGSGKSTTAMHVAVALAKMGFSTGVCDLDSRQGTMSRYLENRQGFADKQAPDMAVPKLQVVHRSDRENKADAAAEETDRINAALLALADCDFVILDTPGSDNHLSRYGHSLADTLVTPVNDSFVDIDLFARIDGETLDIGKGACYADMVWQQRQIKHKREKKQVDWVVIRNRLSQLDAKNKRLVAETLEKLAKRYGFRVAPGFGERVIYRELFLKGLTLLDVRDQHFDQSVTMSHVAARNELRALLGALKLPGVTERIAAI